MREIIKLSGWRLGAVLVPGTGPAYGFIGDQEPPHVPTRTREWTDTMVPGSVQDTLLALGELPDPYYADNLDHWKWVEEREWWYRTTFSAPSSLDGHWAVLRFECLDTCATLYLNGEDLGTHANYFRPFEVDVTKLLRTDRENVLAVQLVPVSHWSAHRPNDGSSGFIDVDRVHTRKPQFSFGWDIAPRLMTVGIGGPVRLTLHQELEIESIHVRTLAMVDDAAEVLALCELRSHLDTVTHAEIAVSIADCLQRVPVTLSPGAKMVEVPFRLKGISRWNVRGRGEQALYACEVSLLCGGRCVDQKGVRFGVRTVELRQEPQADGGTSFEIAVNGEAVFVKGLNYTPGDALLSRIDDERTEELLQLAYECNVNLLRVWGGGYYESDYFFDRCDELGVLVWQDFMFACGQYPQNEPFVKEVRFEAEYQLRRLRNHPSLVFLAGDNENDCFHAYADSDAYLQCKITRGVLESCARELCPDIPYIPSSPISPPGVDPLSCMVGDNHLWDHDAVHDDEPYRSDASRFMSEMGRLSLPPLEVIERFLPPDQYLPLTNRLWRYHAADTERAGFGDRMQSLLGCMEKSGYSVDGTIEKLIAGSQELQAKAITYWVETYHASPVCSGIILWNLCDCWPQMSDAIVAYPNIPKPAYYALRDAYAAIPW